MGIGTLAYDVRESVYGSKRVIGAGSKVLIGRINSNGIDSTVMRCE